MVDDSAANINDKTLETKAKNKPFKYVLLSILMLLLFGVFVVQPTLSDLGVTVPVDRKMSIDINAKYGPVLSELEIGHIASGSQTVANWDMVRLFEKYTVLPGSLLMAFDYGAPISTPHAHILRTHGGYEVRYDADKRKSYSEELRKIEGVVQFAIDKYKEEKTIQATWQ